MTSSLTWIPCELHSHTVHSDGGMSLKELAISAGETGIGYLALTDHNTISGHAEIAGAEAASGIRIIRGMEWTTFFGHMLVLGSGTYVDWRQCAPDGIQEGAERVHAATALAGIAHPFRPGTPMCTGCYWEFEPRDWSAFDYVEVWSGLSPHRNASNRRAFGLWNRLLDSGIRIAGTSGRDWHGGSHGEEEIAVTWLGIEGPVPADQEGMEAVIRGAIKAGRTSVSRGPLLAAAVRDAEGKVLESGGRAEAGKGVACRLEVDLDWSVRPGLWRAQDSAMTLKAVTNRGVIAECPVSRTTGNCGADFDTEGISWLRVELHGVGLSDLIAFAGPVYFHA